MEYFMFGISALLEVRDLVLDQDLDILDQW